MTSQIHPDLGPEVCYVSHLRSRGVESCTIGISIALLALMVESRDSRARAIKSEVKEVCKTGCRPWCTGGYCFPFIIPVRSVGTAFGGDIDKDLAAFNVRVV
jgi:hypothetical protein